MKKIIFPFWLFFLLISTVYGQSSFSELTIKAGNYFGFSIGKKNSIKKIMLVTGGSFTVEKNIKAGLYITSGLDFFSVKYNYNNTANGQAFSNNNFLMLPVTLKKYYMVGKRSHIFFDAGFAAAWYLSSKEDYENNTSNKKSNLGLNAGLFVALGFKTQLTKIISFDAGFKSFQDYLYSYKNTTDKLTIKSNTLITSFYFDIK